MGTHGSVDPRPYQLEAVLELAEHDYTGIVRMATGAGKTLTALWAVSHEIQSTFRKQLTDSGVRTDQDWRDVRRGAARALSRTVLIVAPVRTADGWARAFKQTALPDLFDQEDLMIIDTRKRGKEHLLELEQGARGVYHIGWELLRTRGSTRNPYMRRSTQKPGGSGGQPGGEPGRKNQTRPLPPSKMLGGHTIDHLILDEGHRAANRGGLTYKVVDNIRRKRTQFLSATPAGDRPANMSGVLNLTWPGMVPRRNEFEERYYVSQVNPYGTGPWSRIYGAEKRPGTVRALAPCWIDVTDTQVRGEFPQPNVQHVSCPLTRSQKAIYDQFRKACIAWLGGHPVAVDLPAHLDMRLRQCTLAEPTAVPDPKDPRGLPQVTYTPRARSSKIDAIKDILNDLPPGEPLIVYTHSKRFLVPLVTQLARHLNPQAAGKVGAEPGPDATEEELISYSVRVGRACGVLQVSGDVKDQWWQWRGGEGRVLCAVISAIGEGVDGLQDRCHTEVWASQDNRVILNKQAAGRLDRQGQTRRVTRYLLQSPGTVDTRAVAPRLDERYRDLEASGLI